MYWIIFGIALVLALIGLVIWFAGETSCSDVLAMVGFIKVLIFGAIAICSLPLFIFLPMTNKTDVIKFKERKIAIEHVLENDEVLDSLTITKEIIECNEWLVEAKSMRQRWGDWSMYPSEVLELEYIARPR